MHNNDKRDIKVDTDVSFARNSDEAQKIVGNLMTVRSQINTYAEGADYKDGQTLKEALEEKKKENKITPAKLMSFLLVIPLLLYAKNKGEQDDIQNKIDEEKKRVKEAIDQSIKDGGDKDMMEEMKKMSKQQKYDIMKAAMKEYSSKMSDSFKNMSDDELKRIVNNLDSNIQKCPSLDQLQIDASAAFVPNAPVAGQTKVNANALKEDRKVEDLTLALDQGTLSHAFTDNMTKGQDVKVTQTQLGIIGIGDVNLAHTLTGNNNIKVKVKGQDKDKNFIVGPC